MQGANRVKISAKSNLMCKTVGNCKNVNYSIISGASDDVQFQYSPDNSPDKCVGGRNPTGSCRVPQD